MRFFAVFALLALPAAAHIELDAPTVRYSNSPGEVNKHCPCGNGSGTQTCGGATTSDPNRNEARVTTLVAGDTLHVEWTETVGHTGRFRVAFDDNGADLDDFNANILVDIADPSGSQGNTGNGNHWAVDVQLPSTPCDHCTLQLLQIMNGNTANPVADPRGASTYFQCADLVLLPAGGAGEGEGDVVVGEGEGDVVGEGEGDVVVGEGEGDVVAEGEGDVVAEGEGETAEGEGDNEGGEGEGEGDTGSWCASSTSMVAPVSALSLSLLLVLRRRRR